MNDSAKTILHAWTGALITDVSRLNGVFSDDLSDEDKAKAEAAFKQISEGFNSLRKLIRA